MESRHTELTIDLGGEQILFESLEAVEELGKPFDLTLDIISEHVELDLLPHLGEPAAIKLTTDDKLQRYFHGLVVEGEFRAVDGAGFHYRLKLQPWTWFLDQNRDYAIYQDLSALDIIKQVLEDAKITDVVYDQLSGSFPVRDYTVQYGESDFAFISRLMEDEGIYYRFEHKSDRHVMVLCNGPNSHKDSDPKTLIYKPTSVSVFNSDSDARSEEADFFITSWTQRVTSSGQAKVTYRDFDFEKPDRPIESVKEEETKHPGDQVEVYGYPGGFTEVPRGEELAEIALKGMRAKRVTYRGEIQSSKLILGTKVQVSEHPNNRLNGEFLVTRTYHSITAESYRTGTDTQEDSFNVAFDAIPSATVYRSQMLTPRPIVHGLESAVVCGPSDEEIFTDEYGRVKVRFHWDRSDTTGEKSTCFIRVSQTGGLGNLILPRIGHEVLVDFLGGDPDRPVVVGRVFNKNNMPVYTLPDHKTRAVWRSKSYRGGGEAFGSLSDVDQEYANEIRLEDKTGEEEFFIHATKDLNTRVHNDETLEVGRDQKITIYENRNLTVEKNETIEITGNRTATVRADDKLTVEGSLSIEAYRDITITCGSSKITMSPSGISIESPTIKVEAMGTLDAKSPKTTVQGMGLLTLQGALVKIN